MMNAEQREKALEALDKKKELERKQHKAMAFHLMAFGKLHFNKVLLPYRILYDIEKQIFEKTFHEVPPNEFYPAPAMTLKTKYLQPTISSTMDIDELERQRAEYKKIVDAEKMDSDKWDYYFARFLLPYDLTSFTDFDFWGKMPEREEKQMVDEFRQLCIEVQADCRDSPEKYYLEENPRLHEHISKYDTSYGYI